MFPKALMVVSGLNPSAQYNITLTFESVDDNVYKFERGNWKAVGKGTIHRTRTYTHPKSPLSGKEWMETPNIEFDAQIRFNNDPDQYLKNQVGSLK